MKLNLALAQISTKLGDVEANLAKHMDYIKQARSEKTDLLVFPELSLTGYVLQDLVASVAHKPTEDDPVFKHLLKSSRDLDLVIGFVDEDSRHRFYIASAYLSGGKVLHVHHKVYLPTYGLFDEGRFFAWGDSIRAFDTRFGRVGMLICEDFWHASPPYLLWLDGADIMLFSSASPGRGLNDKEKLESARWVERVTKAYASMFTSFVAHANRVGYEDGLHFWGGGTLFDPNGEEVAIGPYNQEALIFAQMDLNQLRRTRARLPLLRDERTNLVQKELNRILSVINLNLGINTDLAREILTGFIKSEVTRIGMSHAVIGLSGGLDSALSCVLAVEALGAENVLAVRMPYKASSHDSLDHAQVLIDQLGVQSKTIEITDMVEPLFKLDPQITKMRMGNIMARERMIVLFDQSEVFKGLVVGTSNKTEILLGYSTHYGDSASAINPIGDLYKAQVRQLSRALKIPAPIIDKPPSADLWEGQTDEAELGFTYEEVDKLLYLLVDQRYSPQEAIEAGFNEKFVNIVTARIQRNQFKRMLPLIAKISNRTVGYDFLYLRDWGT